MKRFVALGLVAAVMGPAIFFGRARIGSDWVTRQPVMTARTGELAPPAKESSGLAASAAHVGVFWTVLDSGNRPHLVAIDSTGAILGRVALSGATNVDWEAVAVGPCPEGTCVYVGDIGDNRARRAGVVVYRLAEPDAAALGAAETERPAESLSVTYPAGPRDAEALLVTPGGDLLIITKGMASAVEAYRIPAAAWGASGAVAAEALGEIGVSPRTAIGRWVTDGAVAPDGERAVIRTYRDIFFFRLGPGGRLSATDPPTLCDISGLEPQGEGITWADDSTFVLAGEAGVRTPGTVHYVRCRWP